MALLFRIIFNSRSLLLFGWWISTFFFLVIFGMSKNNFLSLFILRMWSKIISMDSFLIGPYILSLINMTWFSWLNIILIFIVILNNFFAFNCYSLDLLNAFILIKVKFVTEVFDISSTTFIAGICSYFTRFAWVCQVLSSGFFFFASSPFSFSVFFVLLSESFSALENQMFFLLFLNMLDLLFYLLDFFFHFGQRILDQMPILLQLLLLLVECACFLLNFLCLFEG